MRKIFSTIKFVRPRCRSIVIAISFLSVLCAASFAMTVLRGTSRSHLAQREFGILAAKRANYVEAIEHLGRYLPGNSRDAEALYYYGVARRHVLAPDGQHLINAIRALRQCCLVNPRHEHAWREIAAAHLAINSTDAALFAARRAKALAPSDHDTACLFIICLIRGGHMKQAGAELDVALQLYADSPHLHLLRLMQMTTNGLGKAEAREYRTALTEANPGEPWAILVTVAGKLLSEDQGKVQLPLPQALNGTLNESDIACVRALLSLLGEARQYEMGLALLASNKVCLQDEFLQLWAVRHCWDLQRTDWIVKHVGTQRLRLATNPETAFFVVIAYRNLGQFQKADEIVDHLEEDTPTEAARSWGHLCRLAVSKSPLDPVKTIETTSVVLRISPGCSIIHRIRAHAWAQLGEFGLAEKSASLAKVSPLTCHVPTPFLNGPVKSSLSRKDISNEPMPTTIEDWKRLLQKGANEYELLSVALGSNSPHEDSELADFLIDRFRTASPIEATGWRLLRARQLLASDNSERAAADVVLTLRPILNAIVNHADARKLQAVALARLHDHANAKNDLLVSVEVDPDNAADALRITLKCREDGFWHDSTGLVDVWIFITRIEARLRRSSSTADALVQDGTSEQLPSEIAVLHRLLVLAEYAELKRDDGLAEATYRRLLQMAPNCHVACNNLAVILGRRSDGIEEARALVRSAIAASPDNRAYRDTLETLHQLN